VVVGDKSPYHSSTASQTSFFRAHLYNRSRPGSCGSCLRRGQAGRHLTEDLLVVSGYRPLHVNTSAFYACFLRQPLELTLKKDFQLLRCQDGNGNSSGLAGPGLDPHAVWRFGLLRFRIHATHPFFYGATRVAGKGSQHFSASRRSRARCGELVEAGRHSWR
jgi:hypothetical protein